MQVRGLIPGYDMALKGKAYATCAVVGASGSLLLQKLGGLIDKHTLVSAWLTAASMHCCCCCCSRGWVARQKCLPW